MVVGVGGGVVELVTGDVVAAAGGSNVVLPEDEEVADASFMTTRVEVYRMELLSYDSIMTNELSISGLRTTC